MSVRLLAATLVFGLACGACSRSETSRRSRQETGAEDTDEEEAPRRRKGSSKKLVFTEAPPSAAPRLTFQPPVPEPTVQVRALDDFFLEAVHRIGPQLRTVEANPRLDEVAIRRERVNAKLITAAGDSLRSIELRGDAAVDRGVSKDLIRKTAKELSERAFSLEEVEWSKLPSLVKDAESRLPDSDGVDFAVVHRPLPFSRDVQIRVFLEQSHFVDYTAKGAFIRTD